MKKTKKRELPAPLLKKIGAGAIDLVVILFVIAMPFSDSVENIIYQESLSSDQLGVLSLIVFFVSVLTVFYFLLFEKKYGQSVGKMLLRLRVETTDGGDLTTGKMILRNLYIVLFPLVGPFVLIDFIGLATSGQRFSEQWSKTRVIEQVST